MNIEQERAEFETWLPKAYRQPQESYSVHNMEVAFAAGYQAGRAALQSQPQETIAYVTRNEGGDPAMLFFDLAEAHLYCNPNEEPEALVLAGSALQSQDREDALMESLQMMVYMVEQSAPHLKGKVYENALAAIDHARRIEGEGE